MNTEPTEQPPVVQAVLLRSSTKRDANLFVIVCPYCGEQHTHGAGAHTGDPQGYVGHRAAHCSADARRLGYVLAWDGTEQTTKGNLR
jgi:hypothetical protein